MAGILDHRGHPIRKNLLAQEIATPTLAGVRQLISDHPSAGLTPQRLARLLRDAEDGDPERYLALAEEMEEKDLHYLSVLGTRKRSVAQLEITVEPASEDKADEENAELVRAWLQRDCIEDELFDVLDAIGKGFSVSEIIWDMSEGQWWPDRIEWVDPRWLKFDRADGRTLLLRDSGGDKPLDPFKFVVHHHKAKSGLPIRGGLARAAAWSYLFKNYALKDWMVFIEVFGQPIRLGKYNPNATDDEKKTLLRAVANIGSDAAAIVPTNMLIEFIEAKRQGSTDAYERFCEYLDKQVSKAVVGQTLTTEVKEGSRAAAQVHNNVREDIERSDAKQLAATLNRDAVRPLIDLNRGPQKAYPRVRIGRPEGTNVVELANALAKLVPQGLRVGQAEVRRKIGMKDPAKGEEILGAPPAGPPRGADGGTAVSAMAALPTDDDSIRDLILDSLGDEWQGLVTPLLAPLRKLFARARSFDELRDGLAEIFDDMDVEDLVDELARASFAVRLAGEVDAPILDS